MTAIISGSIAYDTIFDFPKRFADTLKSDALEHLNLTFEASSVQKAFGGCAANIARSLKALGGDPLIWTAVGRDIGPYLEFLREKDIRTEGITVLDDEWSAQCSITTDINGCQLTTFHSGAMKRAGEASFPDDPTIDIGILAPSTRSPALSHAQAFVEHRIPFILDTGQTTPQFTAREYLDLFEMAIAAAFSDYEADMIRAMTGLDARALSRRGKMVFQTHGAKGSTVWIEGEAVSIETPEVTQSVNPVGAGDFYRGGLLWGFSNGLDPIASARLASVMGAARAANSPINRDIARSVYKQYWENSPF